MITAAVRALEALGQKLLGGHVKPRVRTLLSKDIRNSVNSLLSRDRLSAIRAVEHRNRQTPVTLTRNAPVSALVDHRNHALLAPRRNPLDVVASLHSLSAESVDRAEPLRSSSQDYRINTSPAMRILVLDMLI